MKHPERTTFRFRHSNQRIEASRRHNRRHQDNSPKVAPSNPTIDTFGRGKSPQSLGEIYSSCANAAAAASYLLLKLGMIRQAFSK
jgi:hypothetical protein